MLWVFRVLLFLGICIQGSSRNTLGTLRGTECTCSPGDNIPMACFSVFKIKKHLPCFLHLHPGKDEKKRKTDIHGVEKLSIANHKCHIS